MRHHHRRLAVAVDRVAHQFENLGARLRVEIPGRLVGEDDRRLAHESAPDCDSLLLSSGELRGTMRPAVLEPDLLHQLGNPGLVGLLTRDRKRQDDVFLGVQHRQQVEELEDEADVLAPQLRQIRVVQIGEACARDRDLSSRRLVQTREDVHQGGLAGAGRPHDCGELSGRHVE